jgi:hypothetical protein
MGHFPWLCWKNRGYFLFRRLLPHFQHRVVAAPLPQELLVNPGCFTSAGIASQADGLVFACSEGGGSGGILGISRHGWCPLKCSTCPTFGLQNYPVTGLLLSNISKLGRARRWGSTADAWVYAGLGGEEWGDADQGGPRLLDGIING